MFKRKEALKIKEMVKGKKVFLASSRKDFIEREEYLIYFYDSEATRDIHSRHPDWKEGNWERYDIDMNTYMLHMPLNTHYEQRVWVYQAKYRRKF